MKNLIKKIEEVAQEKIFMEADEKEVLKFLGEIENEFDFIKIPKELKEFLLHCSVPNFYEFETDNILIRFENINNLMEENLEGILLNKGLFVFANNSACDIYFVDLTVNGNYEIYLGSTDLFFDEEEISFYKGGMQSLEFSYENIIKMSIKIADNFADFVKKVVNEEEMTYDVVEHVIDRFVLE